MSEMTTAELVTDVTSFIYTNTTGQVDGDKLQTRLLNIIESTVNTLDFLPLSGANGGTGVANSGKSITLGGNITTAANLIQSGAFALTLTTTAASNATIPEGSGTLAYLAGNNTWAGTTVFGGTVTFATTSTIQGNMSFNDGRNIVTGTSTGTMIGVTAAQKLGFFGTSPKAQQTSSITPATFAANSSGINNDTATWNGYTVGDIVAILQTYGLIA